MQNGIGAGSRTPRQAKQSKQPKVDRGVDRAVSSSPEDFLRADAREALTDSDLIEGIRSGSESHFNELYHRYFQRIYNFVYGRIRNHADAEEIVQETFTIVFSSMKKYSGRSSLLSWIYGIAKNTTNNGLRQTKNVNQRMQEIGSEQLRPIKSFASCTPEEQLSIQRYLKDVVEQLEEFGDWQVEIFDMRHLQNMSIREISERTHRSSDSVRSCLYRVKRLLLEAARIDSPPPPCG
jgi:RNA polymerase sigma-70 factor (ECF subfamily)